MRRKLQVMIGPEDLAIWGRVRKLFGSKAPGLTRFCSKKEACRILKHENVFVVFCENQLMDGTFEDLQAASKQVRSRTRIVISSAKTGPRESSTLVRENESGTPDSPREFLGPKGMEWVVICAIRDKEAVRATVAWHGRF